MTEWKECEYEITNRGFEKNETRHGVSNGIFGICLEAYGYYVVTHLATGLKLDALSNESLAATKYFCDIATATYKWNGKDAEEIASSNGMTKKQMSEKIKEISA